MRSATREYAAAVLQALVPLVLALAAGGIILLLLGFLAVAAPRFFLPEALRALVVRNASVLVAAVGMTLVIHRGARPGADRRVAANTHDHRLHACCDADRSLVGAGAGRTQGPARRE